jgi:hypothetical protein
VCTTGLLGWEASVRASMKILIEDVLGQEVDDLDEDEGLDSFGDGHDIVEGSELLAVQLRKV